MNQTTLQALFTCLAGIGLLVPTYWFLCLPLFIGTVFYSLLIGRYLLIIAKLGSLTELLNRIYAQGCPCGQSHPLVSKGYNREELLTALVVETLPIILIIGFCGAPLWSFLLFLGAMFFFYIDLTDIAYWRTTET